MSDVAPEVPATAAPAEGTAPAPEAPKADAAPGEAPKPEGEKPAEAKETDEQKRARLASAGKAARARAARHRELEAKFGQQSRQLQQVSTEAQTYAQKWQALEELRARDPIAAAAMLGLNGQEIMEAAKRETDPNAKAEARIRAAEARAEKAEKVVSDFVNRIETEQTTRQQQEIQKQAVAGFLKESGDATAFPKVSAIPDSARLAWAQQLLAEDRARARAAGVDLQTYQPTNKQLLAHMEKLLAGGSGPGQSERKPSDATPAEQNGSTKPQTVSNALTSATHSLPPDPDKMSDAEWKTAMARWLEGKVAGAKQKKRG